MHEFSIATQILDSVLEFALARPSQQVLKVRLEIGEMMCVEAEQLRFCYDSIKKETALENSDLEIAFLPAVVQCPHCQYEGSPKYWDGALAGVSIPTLQCPQCGKAAETIQGHDCAIKTIQLLDLKNTDNERDPFSNALRSDS
jgi:hydrogenase nickel incorporation protein HypA/HybF